MKQNSFVKCEDCGERHTPSNKNECIETLRNRIRDLTDEVALFVKMEKESDECIDAETDCILSGNMLTPSEQEIAVKVARNIKTRMEAL